MAQTIKLKRSNTAGNLPTTSDLALGEVAINTKDGKFFLRKHVDGTDSGDAITAYAPQGLNVYGTQTFEVKVITKTASHPQYGTGSASGYSIDGLESPFIVLVPGNTYKFDQSDSSNTGHPLAFYLEEDKTTSYTTSVTTNGTPGSSGAYTQIVVSTSTPQVLYYQCSSHAYMGSGSYTLSDAIADGKVGTAQLAANAVTSAKIAANSVDSSELVTGSIDTIHIGDLQVTSAKIANNTIATGNIADNAVDATKIASNSILTRHIDDNQVGIDQLNVTDGTSGQALITDGAGTLSFSTVASSLSGASDTDITTPSSGQILVHDGTDSFDNVSISGDATLSSAGVLTIATNAIESTMIAQNSILTKHIDDNQIGIDQLNVTDGTNGQVLTTDGAGSLSFSTVSGGGSQNVFTTIAVSGQSNVVADSTTDTLTLAAGTGITLTTNASTDTITITGTTGLSANSVTATEIATGAVGPSELAATTVTAGSYTNTDITVDADGRITSASNGTAVIADGAITTAKLADDAVTADKLANTAVTAGTYGSTTVSPQITVDAQGRITNVSNQTISGGGGSGGIGLNQTVSVYEGTGDGSTTAFNTGTTINAESLTWVFVDGVYQEKGTYSTSGSTVTFSTAPPNGTSIEVNNLSNVTTGGAFNHNSYNGDGSTTDFTLSKAPGSDTDLIVFIDGVYQNADAFNVSSTTLSFDTAPANGTKVIAYTIGGVVMGKTMIVDTFSGNGSTTAFTLSMDPTKEENTQVYVGGVYQPKGTYSLSGTTLTFSEAPPTGTSNIEVNISQVTTLTEVGANSVSATSIAANAVGSAEIAANSVDSSELVTGSIDTIHIGDDQVTNAKLAVNSVSAVELAGNSVTSTQIAANQVGISELNVSDGTNGQVLSTNGTGTLSFTTISETTINNNADNRVITGSGTANTLNGESGLTYDGSTLAVTGDANFDSNTLFVDASANTVGIGTSSPSQKLTVSTTSASQAILISTSSADSDSGIGFTNDARSWSLANRGGLSDSLVIRDISAGADRVTVNSSGNVAIGTTNPSAGLLTLSGVDGGSTAGIYFNNTTASTGKSYRLNSGNTGEFMLYDITSSAYRIFVNTSGNVGIGNASPAYKLDVSGTAATNGLTVRTNALRLESLDTSVGDEQSIGDIEFYANDSSTGGTGVQAKISSLSDSAFGVSYALSFQTGSGASPSEKMRIDSSGNVGIGVTPTHNFNLQSAGTVEARFRSTDADCRLQISSDTDEGQDSILEFLSGTSTRGSIAYDHNPTATSQNMLFKTGDNAVTAMRIDGSGRVGINRTPAIANAKLEVGGADNVPLINVEASGTTGGMGVGSSKVQIYHGTSAKLFLTADGSLGVNESVPTGKIHVRDNNFSGYMGVFSQGGSGGANHGMFIETASGSSYLMIQKVSGTTHHYVAGNGNYYFSGTAQSDLNKKENIADISNGLDVVNNLRPRTFNFKENSTVDKAGFIAQEAQIVEPRLVTGNEFDETQTDEEGSNPTGLGFDYMGYTAYLTKAIQEQQTIIDDLKSRLDEAGL